MQQKIGASTAYVQARALMSPVVKGFGRRPSEPAAPSLIGPASETLHNSGMYQPRNDGCAKLANACLGEPARRVEMLHHVFADWRSPTSL